MALTNTGRWWLVASLVATLVSCREPARTQAAYKQPARGDVSLPKGGDPARALPSHVVTGDVAAYDATPADGSVAKSPDTAGALPSTTAQGTSAVYAPGGRP